MNEQGRQTASSMYNFTALPKAQIIGASVVHLAARFRYLEGHAEKMIRTRVPSFILECIKWNNRSKLQGGRF